jgi:hypothetical protein
VDGSLALKSKKRFDEAVTIYQRDVPEQWHHETAIKHIVEHMALAEVEDQARELQAKYLVFASKHQ